MIGKSRNMRPALMQIGETLSASTKRRFQSSTAPDGSKWDPNSPVTISRFTTTRRVKGVHVGRKDTVTKNRKLLSSTGEQVWDSKKPLIGHSKSLGHSITYQAMVRQLLVGSPMIYAVTQQFGAKKGSFGSDKRGRSIPWGDIPARPFLGISDADRVSILQIAADFLL